MTMLNELEEANRRYAESFDQGDRPMPPARHVAVVTCMDARLHPEKFLGLDIGDAHVIRNAGGRVSDDAIRSLVISNQLLGTEEIAVIHHTDCGMLTFSNEDLRAKLAEGGADAGDVDFLPFSDNEQSVRDDVDAVRSSPFIPDGIAVKGYIYDVTTGLLDDVEGAVWR
ncbi:MAG: beta-class carbonic anhydrase [Acidimicrobiales bacterium]